jgi:branched-chain amino acid transport system ATP-binding protein
MEMLRIENLVFNYGNILALKGITFTVNAGEIVTLIGANGAGKSTTMNIIAGLLYPGGGKIFYNGEDITSWESQRKVQNGIVLSPEGRQVFPEFTVSENLMMGGYLRTDEENEESLKVVNELFPVLYKRQNQQAGTLSGGEQQMLAIARAVMSKPKLLMLDEPSMGLAPLLVKEIFDLIDSIHRMGATVLFVEQNAKMALKFSDRAYVLETGSITLSGNAEELLNSEAVQKAYLGM